MPLTMQEQNALALGTNMRVLPAEFTDWLLDPANIQLWRRFKAEADRVVSRGRKHYSARTIIEVIRHETMLADADPDYKVNNNAAPDMARFYMVLTGQKIFETRGR